MYIIVRFFSLLSRLFLLERGAKREKQPPLPNYFYFRCCSNYCAWKVFFALVLWWSQFEYHEKNRIPWKKTFRILSLSLSLSYSVRKSALFPPALLSFASFERAFEKNYSVQTPLLLLLFVVLVLVLLLKNTNTSNWSREKKSEFLSRFLLFFFSRAELLSVCLLFSSLLFLFRFFRSLFTFFLFARTHAHDINNTRPKIMVRSLYTYARIRVAFVFVVFLVLFSLLKEKSSWERESRVRVFLFYEEERWWWWCFLRANFW